MLVFGRSLRRPRNYWGSTDFGKAFPHTERHVDARLRQIYLGVCQKQHTCLTFGFWQLGYATGVVDATLSACFAWPVFQQPSPSNFCSNFDCEHYPFPFLCSLVCESYVFMRKMHRGFGVPASLQSPDADNVLHPAFHVFVPAASALWACNSGAVHSMCFEKFIVEVFFLPVIPHCKSNFGVHSSGLLSMPNGRSLVRVPEFPGRKLSRSLLLHPHFLVLHSLFP